MKMDTGLPWAALGLAVIIYEAWALIAKRRTLSEQVWAAEENEPWDWLLPLLMAIGMVVLWLHFSVRMWDGKPDEQ